MRAQITEISDEISNPDRAFKQNADHLQDQLEMINDAVKNGDKIGVQDNLKKLAKYGNKLGAQVLFLKASSDSRPLFLLRMKVLQERNKLLMISMN